MKVRTHTTQRATKMLEDIATKKSVYWERHERTSALALFKEAAKRVPAYKDFLKQNNIDPEKITTWKQFQTLPITDKNNYLRKYPLEQLCWDGTLKKPMVFASTSGSTGKPFYFPRDRELDWQQSILNELFLKNTSLSTGASTLVIITFGMGVWIGGLINYQAFELVSNRGYPVSILTPGVNKDEILKALHDLAPLYEQTVIVGYPPFVKDIVDDANAQNIPIKDFNLRFLFAAEAFTEKFRDYIVREAGVKNALLDTLNIYGTADIGPMAFETPVTILIRRLANEDKELFRAIFPDVDKTPTLAQYNPHFITFEAPDGNILVTGNSTVPFIRNSIGDHGGVMSFDTLRNIMQKHDIDIVKECVKHRIPLYEFPLVYIYERSDFSTNLYGIQIYPEYLRDTFVSEPAVKMLTGKFTLMTKYDDEQNQYLEINVELKKNAKRPTPRQKKQIFDIVEKDLRTKSSEYKELSNYMQERDLIVIEYWPAEDPLHFLPEGKQKWVKK